MQVLAGTSGFSYTAWRGSFYPEDLSESAMLAYYAERFRAVEINNSFYKMPSEKTVAGWAAQVPENFRFALKASQKITHFSRLKDAAEPLAFFCRVAATLGPRLGPSLFQLPPNFKKDVPRLAAFLALLPDGFRVAFEFRHASWFDDETYAALSARGAALCIAEDEDLATPLVPTTGWGFLRLRREDYDHDAVHAWAGRIRAQPWNESYVFFKHEDAGKGPALAKQLLHKLSTSGGLSS